VFHILRAFATTPTALALASLALHASDFPLATEMAAPRRQFCTRIPAQTTILYASYSNFAQ
jgi:hypothetical protein